MNDDKGAIENSSVRRRRKWLSLSAMPVILAVALGFSSPAAATTLNLNGSAPGIQSAAMYPNNAMWVNTPTEYNISPQSGGGGPVPGQVVSSTTSYQTVTTPIYQEVAEQGQQWVSSGYWATGETWVNSGYFQLHTWWAETGYWAWGATTIYGGYWVGGSPGHWQCYWTPIGNSWGCYSKYWVNGTPGYWQPTTTTVWSQYWVSTAHWASDYWWIDTSHWQSYSYWVSTAHWESDYHWVDTSHWQSYSYWVNTSHWETYTYWVNEIVGYSTSVVPVVTKITDSNINLSNETLLGVQPEIKNTTTGQTVDGSFCSTPTTPLISPTSPSFPDYSGSPWEYANFFSGQGICNVNPGILPTTTFDQWAVAQQSVQLVLIPSWSATVSYNQVTTVNGSVTSSVPVTTVETITGTPYTSSAMPTKYLVGISCAVQNGQPYCPTFSGN